MKKCRTCNETKELTEYWIRDHGKQVYRTECKKCLNKFRRKQKSYNTWKLKEGNKQKLKEYMRNYDLNRHYNITTVEYNDKLIAQNNSCAICETKEPRGKGNFKVDHCHKTNKVRDLLCNLCNVGLGSFKDNEDLMLKAIKYLRKHNEK